MSSSRLALFASLGLPLFLWAAPLAQSGGGPPGGPPGGMPPRAVRLGAIAQVKVRDEVLATGTVDPWTFSVVAAETDGQVATLPVREGAAVAAGAPLAQLTPDERKLRLAVAEARVEVAKAGLDLVLAGEREEVKVAAAATVTELERRLEIARDAAQRAESLSSGDRPVIDPARAEDLRREAAAAEARLVVARMTLRRLENGARPEEIVQARAAAALAQAERDLADLDLARCQVTCPFAGRIVRLRTEVGQWVVKGGPIAEVQDTAKVFVTAGIGERDIPHVVLGAPVVVVLDAYPGREFAGHVERLVPTADVATRSFPVRIALTNAGEGLPEEPLKPGMYARVRVGVGAERLALFAPTDAVVSDAQGTSVFLVEAGKARRLPVRKGLLRGATVEVVGEGLAPGTPLIVSGNEVGMMGPLRDGDAVMPAVPSGPPPGAAPGPTGAAPTTAPAMEGGR